MLRKIEIIFVTPTSFPSSQPNSGKQSVIESNAARRFKGILLSQHSLCSLEYWMPKLNPALFEPLTRIENACRRASGVMLNTPSLSPPENELVRREIQEIRDALEAFKAAVEAGEVTGFKARGLTSHDN
jgi:hypothetical protein